LDFQQQGQRRGSLRRSLFRDTGEKKNLDDNRHSKGLFKTRKLTDEQINVSDEEISDDSNAQPNSGKEEELMNPETSPEEPTQNLQKLTEHSNTEINEKSEDAEETEEKIRSIRAKIPPPKKPVITVEQPLQEFSGNEDNEPASGDQIIEKTLAAIMSSSASRRKVPEIRSALKTGKLGKSKTTESSRSTDKRAQSARIDQSDKSRQSKRQEKESSGEKAKTDRKPETSKEDVSTSGVSSKAEKRDVSEYQKSSSRIDHENITYVQKENKPVENIDSDEMVKKKKALPYDWGRTTKFSADQKKFLERVFNQFADLVMTKVAPLVQTRFTLEYQSAKLRPYGNFTQNLCEPIVLIVSRIDPEHQGLLVIDFPLSFALIDRCLGGKGETLDELRYFTEIETVIFERIARKLTESYREAWCEIKECKPHLICMEFNPQMVHIVKPSDLMVCITFEARVANMQGPLYVALPYDYLKTVLPKANFEEFMLTRSLQTSASPTVAPLFAKNLEQAKVPVSIDLGSTELMFQELTLLDVGDFIILDQELNKPLKIRVNEKAKFLGKPGVRDNKISVQVVKVLQEGDEEFEE
jgi:flagellar motor switch protein FliM